MGVEVAHHQVRNNAQCFPMLQAAVAADIEIVFPQAGADMVIPPDIRPADDHTAFFLIHFLMLPIHSQKAGFTPLPPVQIRRLN